jgi:large subunit ribosomal protein L2
MGKRIILQARGHGSLTYRARPRAYRYELRYPKTEGKAKAMKLINSCAHSSPLVLMKVGKEMFYNVAVDGLVEKQEVEVGREANATLGSVLPLSRIPVGTDVCNIENIPYNGPRLIRTSGGSARITKVVKGKVFLMLPSKQERSFDGRCRATVGIICAGGRLDKPVVKAGKKFHMMKARNKLWPRTSAVKMNAVDHPFGCGRGKRIKSKIAKRNSPPGANVGLLHPRRTGRKK